MENTFRQRRTLSAGTRPRRGDNLQPTIDKIDAMIGLDPVKAAVSRLIDFARVVKLKKDRDLPVSNPSFHMVFSGPPGTGKTTIARHIGTLLYELALLRKDKLVEVDRSQIVGSAVGETAKLVQDKVAESLDGVLFIDEAYTLAGGGGALGRTDPYGQEAIDTLIKLMEDQRERLVIIFAGYTGEMRRFMDANPGLRSRIAREIEFPGYDRDELVEIFAALAASSSYRLASGTLDAAAKLIAGMPLSDPGFGNAREIRRMFEELQQVQAERIAAALEESDDIEALDNETLMTLTMDDVAQYAERM